MHALSHLVPAFWALLLAMLKGTVAKKVRENLTVSRVAGSGGGGGGGSSNSSGNGGGARKGTHADDGIAFVDGSVNAGAAGIGVWYGAGHRLNYSAAVSTSAADNNITAGGWHLTPLHSNRHLRVFSSTQNPSWMPCLRPPLSSASPPL